MIESGIEDRVGRHEEELFVLLQSLLLCELIDELNEIFLSATLEPRLLRSANTDLTDDLFSFAVAETLSICSAAPDGVSFGLEFANYLVNRLLGRSPADLFEIGRQAFQGRLDSSDAGACILQRRKDGDADFGSERLAETVVKIFELVGCL